MKSIYINQQSTKPIYQQLYEQIASKIIKQELKKETKLPSIRTAAKELRVSIITIKKTWEMLEQDNLIYTIVGKGAYVVDINKEKLSSKKWNVIDNELNRLIESSKNLGITLDELLEQIKSKY